MSNLRSLTCRLLAGTSVILSLIIAGSVSTPASEAAPVTDVAAYADVAPAAADTVLLAAPEMNMLAEHNRLRAQTGAVALTIDPELERVARIRSQDMAVRNYFSHYAPTGETAFDLLDTDGFVAYSQAENIASNN